MLAYCWVCNWNQLWTDYLETGLESTSYQCWISSVVLRLPLLIRLLHLFNFSFLFRCVTMAIADSIIMLVVWSWKFYAGKTPSRWSTTVLTTFDELFRLPRMFVCITDYLDWNHFTRLREHSTRIVINTNALNSWGSVHESYHTFCEKIVFFCQLSWSVEVTLFSSRYAFSPLTKPLVWLHKGINPYQLGKQYR